MRVKFFGTRGSIATPGQATLRYGGNTSCVQLVSNAGTLVLLDCGTGAYAAGQALSAAAGSRPLSGAILITHTHWDHIQGFPFFAPLFVRGNQWDVYAPRGLGPSLREALSGQMQYTYFPVDLEQLGATVRYHELVEGVFDIGDIRVHAQYLNHPGLTLGYRLEADGAAVVYACDHEPHARELASGEGEMGSQDSRHAAFMADADLVIHDAQYVAEEYAKKAGWGHSTVQYAVRLARDAKARTLALTHHDPAREDSAVDRIVAAAAEALRRAGSPLRVLAAAEGMTLELGGEGETRRPPANEHLEASAMTPAIVERTALLAVADPALLRLLRQPLHDDAVRTMEAADGDAACRIAGAERPALLLIERDLPGIDGLEACRRIRAGTDEWSREVPIVVVADREDMAAGRAAGVTDWLVTPFSAAYARSRIRAWLMRRACRWARAPMPPDEEQRLATLSRLNILDSEPEERFERLTRLAAALFKVPTAVVSLIDRDRNWVMGCCGAPARQTTREASFCAHAVAKAAPEIVPDALLDDRFADNPHVVGEPRIRFYAGYPLMVDGSCLGTLCMVDTRPRQLSAADLDLLRDLAQLVSEELGRPARLAPTNGGSA
jgi:phosphoribosyl 1,2-cyclic phosphodiesterase/GAF domain-containing protein